MGEYMKISKISDSDLFVFYYSNIVSTNNVEILIKKIINNLKIFHLNGYYKVIYSLKNIGLFFKIIKVDSSYCRNSLDLNILNGSFDIYFKTSDYFIIKNKPVIRLYNGMYYVLVDDSFFDIIDIVEFGEFVFVEDDFLVNSIIVNR